jgi:hypothetical protein
MATAGVDVGVVADDHWRVAAQFHRHRRYLLGCKCSQVLADRRRTGERDLADDRRADQGARDHVGVAHHDVEHAVRQSRFCKRLRDEQAGAWGFLGRLDDHRAAGRQRRRHLAAGEQRRQVPWRKRGHRTDRFARHDRTAIRIACFHGSAIDALCLFRAPQHGIDRHADFHARLAEWPAHFQRQSAGKKIGALANQQGSLGDDVRPGPGRYLAPGLEGLRGRGQGRIQVGSGGVRHIAEAAAIGGIEHGGDSTPFSAQLFAVDPLVELGVGALIHDFLHHLRHPEDADELAKTVREFQVPPGRTIAPGGMLSPGS